MRVCVCVRARACVRTCVREFICEGSVVHTCYFEGLTVGRMCVCVCVCVCVREREREREREI